MRELFQKSAIKLGFCIAVLSGSAGIAQEITEFSFSETNKGYFLIDRETGVLSHCIQAEATLSCSVVLEKEVDLQARLLRLERDLAGVRADLLAQQSASEVTGSAQVNATEIVNEPSAPSSEATPVSVAATTEPAAAPVQIAETNATPAVASSPEPVQPAQADVTAQVTTPLATAETVETPVEPPFARDSFLGRLSRYLPNTAKDLAAIAAFSQEAFARFLDLVTDLKEEHGYA